MSSTSDAAVAAFLRAETPAEVNDAAGGLGNTDEAAAFADALLAAVIGADSWQRHRLLDNLRSLEGTDGVVERFATALGEGGDAKRRNAARSALAVLAAPGSRASATALVALEKGLADVDGDVRVLAASALGESGNPMGRDALERALRDPDSNVVAAAADALGLLGDARAVDALAEVALGSNLWNRAAAVVALGRLGDPNGIDALANAAAEPLLARAAADALGEIGDPRALDALRTISETGPPPARAAAQRAAALILSTGAPIAPPEWLRRSVRTDEEALAREFRGGAATVETARLLGLAGSDRAADALLEAATDPDRLPAAAAGLGLLPAELLVALLARVPAAEQQSALLAALPPLADAAAVRSVAAHLQSDDDEIRIAAAEALGRSPPRRVLPSVLDALEEPASRRGAAEALSRMCEVPPDRLTALLHDADPRVRETAADGLARCGARTATAEIVQALRRESESRPRQAMIRALGAVGGEDAVGELARLLKRPEPASRFAAARALGSTGVPAALHPLLEALVDTDAGVQAAALRALGELRDPRAAPRISTHLDETDLDLRRTATAALAALAALAPAGAVERLLQALEDSDWEVRLAAARAFERIPAAAAVAPLRQMMSRDPELLVRQAAARALDRQPNGATGADRDA